jgi:D-alanyl-D-alanine dipeptidase
MLVNPLDFDIAANKIYYYRQDIREKFDISIQELEDIGIKDGVILIDSALIKPLLNIQAQLAKHNLNFIIVDGYRSKELYQLAYSKRILSEGKTEIDKIFNMLEMPHLSGLVIDIGLLDLSTNQPVPFFDSKRDGKESWFIGFYKTSDNPNSAHFQNLQDLLITLFTSNGFKIGSKKEVWHFEY